MGATTRLVLIAVLAPLGVLLAFFFVVGRGNPKFFMIVVAYPFMLAATLFLGFLLHCLFQRWRMRRGMQVIVVIAAAVVGGLVITLLVMTPRWTDLSQIPALLLREPRETLYFFGFWCSFGIATGLAAWLLYSFGPLKLGFPVDRAPSAMPPTPPAQSELKQ